MIMGHSSVLLLNRLNIPSFCSKTHIRWRSKPTPQSVFMKQHNKSIVEFSMPPSNQHFYPCSRIIVYNSIYCQISCPFTISCFTPVAHTILPPVLIELHPNAKHFTRKSLNRFDYCCHETWQCWLTSSHAQINAKYAPIVFCLSVVFLFFLVGFILNS